MDSHDTLFQQLTLLQEIIHASPYLSHHGRKGLKQEISELSEKLQEGIIPFPQGEKTICDLNKKAAADEIACLITKIGHLNPSSPRLERLRALSHSLNGGEISADQARRTLVNLMQS